MGVAIGVPWSADRIACMSYLDKLTLKRSRRILWHWPMLQVFYKPFNAFVGFWA